MYRKQSNVNFQCYCMDSMMASVQKLHSIIMVNKYMHKINLNINGHGYDNTAIVILCLQLNIMILLITMSCVNML